VRLLFFPREFFVCGGNGRRRRWRSSGRRLRLRPCRVSFVRCWSCCFVRSACRGIKSFLLDPGRKKQPRRRLIFRLPRREKKNVTSTKADSPPTRSRVFPRLELRLCDPDTGTRPRLRTGTSSSRSIDRSRRPVVLLPSPLAASHARQRVDLPRQAKHLPSPPVQRPHEQNASDTKHSARPIDLQRPQALVDRPTMIMPHAQGNPMAEPRNRRPGPTSPAHQRVARARLGYEPVGRSIERATDRSANNQRTRR